MSRSSSRDSGQLSGRGLKTKRLVQFAGPIIECIEKKHESTSTKKKQLGKLVCACSSFLISIKNSKFVTERDFESWQHNSENFNFAGLWTQFIIVRNIYYT